jgi:hypothetical protein
METIRSKERIAKASEHPKFLIVRFAVVKFEEGRHELKGRSRQPVNQMDSSDKSIRPILIR